MKTFRHWLLLLGLLFGFSCSKDLPSEAPPSPSGEKEGHKVEVLSALSELDSVLSEIEPETRTDAGRTVGSVSLVTGSAVLPGTRSDENLAIEDLVYIANFEGGAGYAILGADDRMPPVLAITDQGSLTVEEFAAVARGEYDETQSPPVRPEVVDYIMELSRGFGDPIISIDPPIVPIYTRYGPWQVAAKVWPLVETKWGQLHPYNYYAPTKNGVKCPAGCVAVAVGQIITNDWYRSKNPYRGLIGGYTISWNSIFNVITNHIIDENNRYVDNLANSKFHLDMARLLHGIGSDVDMKYESSASSSNIDEAAKFLSKVGYQNVQKVNFTEDRLKSMLWDIQPVYVRGADLKNEGHAWIVDGLCEQRRVVQKMRGLTVISSSEESRMIVHCNFGWSGKCDGYYYMNSFFNPSLPAVEKEPGDGDHNSAVTDSFSRDLKILMHKGF